MQIWCVPSLWTEILNKIHHNVDIMGLKVKQNMIWNGLLYGSCLILDKSNVPLSANLLKKVMHWHYTCVTYHDLTMNPERGLFIWRTVKSIIVPIRLMPSSDGTVKVMLCKCFRLPGNKFELSQKKSVN